MTLIQPQSMTLDRNQLVHLLGTSESAFDRARKKLEENHFPQKLPGMTRWSRPAVVAWIKANGNLDLMHRILIGDGSEPEDTELPDLEAPASLTEKYGGTAA